MTDRLRPYPHPARPGRRRARGRDLVRGSPSSVARSSAARRRRPAPAKRPDCHARPGDRRARLRPDGPRRSSSLPFHPRRSRLPGPRWRLAERGAGDEAELLRPGPAAGAPRASAGTRWPRPRSPKVRAEGADSLTIAGARHRKAVMDEFRRQNVAYREHVHAQGADAARAHAGRRARPRRKRSARCCSAAGWWLIERSARRRRAPAPRRARVRRDAAERRRRVRGAGAAQAPRRALARRRGGGRAEPERQRQPSRREHRYRAGPGTGRGGSTAPARATASPSGAVTRILSRSASEEPLQPCGLCGALPGASRCTPSLVGGEVIGSLLVRPPATLGPYDEERLLARRRPGRARARQPAQPGDRRAPGLHRRASPACRTPARCGRRSRAWSRRPSGAPLCAARRPRPLQAINDRYGHQAGDEVLAAGARRCGRRARERLRRSLGRRGVPRPAARHRREGACSAPSKAPGVLSLAIDDPPARGRRA